MSEDNAELFGDEAAPVTTTEAISPEAPKGPARDESGRFAPADKGETQPAPAPVETSAPPAPKPEAPDVPLKVVLEERDKRQRAERELEELRRQLAAAQRQQQAPQIPDPIEDQQGFTQSLLSVTQQAVLAERLNISAFIARDKFGDEIVDEAMRYFDTQPYEVSAQFLRSPMPMVEAVKWFQRQKAVEEIGPDPDAYRAKIEAEVRARLQEEMSRQQAAAASVPPRQAPPRSLAAAPGAGGSPPVASGSPLFD